MADTNGNGKSISTTLEIVSKLSPVALMALLLAGVLVIFWQEQQRDYELKKEFNAALTTQFTRIANAQEAEAEEAKTTRQEYQKRTAVWERLDRSIQDLIRAVSK